MSEINKVVCTGEDLKEYVHRHSKAEVAEAFADIVLELCKAADEFSDKFIQLKNKHQELFALTDIGMITAVSAAPFEDRSAPVTVLLGSSKAIQLTASAIISGIKRVANDKN